MWWYLLISMYNSNGFGNYYDFFEFQPWGWRHDPISGENHQQNVFSIWNHTSNWNVYDNIYGPCIHTVVTQMIKGVSLISGGSSWALLQHPDGLPCDLFVTHAWSEGIFEFIDSCGKKIDATEGALIYETH